MGGLLIIVSLFQTATRAEFMRYMAVVGFLVMLMFGILRTLWVFFLAYRATREGARGKGSDSIET